MELIRDNGQILRTTSATDGTFSFSIALGEPVQVRIPPYNGFQWSTTYSSINIATTASRRLHAFEDLLATSAKPTRPPNTPKPTSRPSRRPVTHNPTPYPSVLPTLSPSTSTPTLINYSPAKMIHRFTFDHTSVSNTNQVPDVLSDLDFAFLLNGVTISDSQAVFSRTINPAAQPYLLLSDGCFGLASAISIELWVTVDKATQDNAVLFSFGDSSISGASVSLTAKGLQGFENTYVAVVVNPPLVQVYINGSLTFAQSIASSPLFAGEGATEKYNYIGWNLKKTTPGFIGSIDEIRLWDGALKLANISETAALGLDPTLVILNTTETLSNIQIDYIVTSEVVVNVGLYGGLSYNRIFGSESVFHIQALDPQCSFNATLALDPFYSANSLLLPAMNYSVTLLPYANTIPAPKFTYTLCSASLDPYTYLSAANELSMEVYSDLLLTSNLYAKFVYHTGLCMSIKGAEYFASSEPLPDKVGRVCYSNTATILTRGQIWPINVTLFELYPSFTGGAPTWISGNQIFDLGSGTAVQDFIVLQSTVEINDVVSGLNSPIVYTYSGAQYSSIGSSTVTSPPTLNYTITTGLPLPTAPYALPFAVSATRNSPEGGAQVDFKAFVPILGTIPSEVPNYYPVTTDPTLIFLILRDPPGGASYTQIQAGSVLSTGISIQGIKTYQADVHSENSDEAGVKDKVDLIEAPVGVGESEEVNTDDANLGLSGTRIAPEVTVSRTSETHYTYSFEFDYDFSTSSDPYLAGHPSDVIVGGGIDIIVSEALEGRREILTMHVFHSTLSLYKLHNILYDLSR